MKHSFLISLFLLSATAVMAVNRSTSMTPIMEKAESMVSLIENDMEMEIVRMEYDLLRTTKTTTRTLSAGWNYVVVAFGDFRFRDIDVRVYRRVDGSWQLIEKDNDSEAVAVVSVRPETEGEYLIEISAYSFYADYTVGHYGLIIAHE